MAKNTTQSAISVKAAYVRVGYKDKYGGGTDALALTTIDESQLEDAALVTLGEARLANKIAEVKAKFPHYNIFKLDIRVGDVAMRNPDYIASADDDND